MQLKKIDTLLQKGLQEAGLTEANFLQNETFSKIKSGQDFVVESGEGTGKTTTLVINIIQKLKKPFEESPRALIMVTDRFKVDEMMLLFQHLGSYNKLRVYGVHDHSDFDEAKNQISLGTDVLIGTPNSLNILFSGAGYDVNRLLTFAFDDIDTLLKNRHDSLILRMAESIPKPQRLFFCSAYTDKIDILAEKIMTAPGFFSSEE